MLMTLGPQTPRTNRLRSRVGVTALSPRSGRSSRIRENRRAIVSVIDNSDRVELSAYPGACGNGGWYSSACGR